MKKICLVGCGTIGKLHARNLANKAELYFSSRSEDSALAYNASFKGAGVFNSLEEAVAREDISGVVIASPPECHKDQVVAALAAGKSVLVEKPMCVSPEEVAEIGEAVTESPGFLMVAENYYYKPSLEKIKTLISEGTIGEVKYVAVKKLAAQVPAGWKTGYGALLEGGIHFVAFVNDLFDDDPTGVRATIPNNGSWPERHSVTTLTYKDGVTATLEYSWNTPSLLKGTFQHSRIEGVKGRIVFESNGIYVTVLVGCRIRLFLPGLGDLMGYGAMTRDFLHCLNECDARPYSDFTRSARDLKVVFEAYKGIS